MERLAERLAERLGPASRQCRRAHALVTVVLLAVVALRAPALPPPSALLDAVSAARRGLPELQREGALEAAASRFAAELLERGALDHRGRSGDRVVDRARRAGVTDVHLGEILGAGDDAATVVEAWLASPSHREVLLGRSWTHLGVGSARSGTTGVWVAVFAERAVAELTVDRGPRGTLLAGRLVPDDAERPLLIVNLQSYEPERWDPRTGAFAFPFDPEWIRSSYVRLGYVRRTGGSRITNVLHARAVVGGLEAP